MDKAQRILDILEKEFPEMHGEFIESESPLQLMVATILAAQCTDARVNQVTEILFKKYKTAKDYAYGDIRKLKGCIKSTGFYNNKAKNIKAACRMIEEDFNGKVPDSMEDLLKLPGVGRKTANIILTHGYGKVDGIPVDVHVGRVSYRLGLTKNTNSDKIEKDLMGLYDKKDWNKINQLFISHGRKTCKAPTPYCSSCPLQRLCLKEGVTKQY